MAQTQIPDPFAAIGGGRQLANGDWVPNDYPGGTPQAGSSPAATPGAGTGASAPVAPSAPATPNSIQGAYQQALQNLMTGPTPQQAGANVATSAPVTAFNAQAKQNEGRDRAFLAERAAAGGFSGSGGMESGILGLRQNANTAMNTFAGNQANTQEQGRRQELMTALSLAQAMGDNNAARQLQQQLGMANIDLQSNQYKDQLGFNYANLQNNMNADVMRTLFGGF